MALPAGTNCSPAAIRAENAVRCRIDVQNTTGRSPRLGTMKAPCAHSIGASVAAAIMQRNAVAHSGGTSCTINFVTGQFTPHASTTPASSAAAPRVESSLAMPNASTLILPDCLAFQLALMKEPVLAK